MNLPLHGSNPKYLYDAYDLNIPEQIMDFSVNLNPYGPPAKLREIWNELYHDAIDYPDPYGQDLVSAIAQHHNLDENMVMIGNGVAELIFLLGQFFAERHVLVVEPAFSEYKKACEAFGCKVFSHVLYDQHNWNIDFVRIEEDVTGKDALFFCHPNNPTGKVYPKDHLLSLVEMAKEHACYVVIDEAFADFCSESTSIVKELQRYPNLIVLRSLTKMYAIAGLRLGYLLAHPEIISKLKQKQPHWSVNAIALKAGLICLKDDQHADRTRQMIDQERNRMIDALQNMGFRCSDSSVNFFLIHDPDIPSMDLLITFLLKKGLVIRHTKNFRGLDGRYIRVAVRKKEENDQLLSALREWKAK